MSQTFDIAVIGATGTVGEAVVQILEEREFPLGELHLLASIESAGRSLPFRGKNVRVRDVAEFDFSRVGLVFFAAGPAITRNHVGRARQAGCHVIDLSAGLASEEAPGIVPEINASRLAALPRPWCVSSPSPAAIAVAMAVAPMLPVAEPIRVSVTACMAVSGLGREGVSELGRQTADLLNMRPLETAFYDRQMAFNLLARVGGVDAEGHTALEKRLFRELRELLQLPKLAISVSCIQAPVFFGDSFDVAIQFKQPLPAETAQALLDGVSGIERVEGDDYPTPVGDAVGQDVVYIGRVRNGIEDDAELNLWITSDNVRKGAALNAVQLAELLIKAVS